VLDPEGAAELAAIAAAIAVEAGDLLLDRLSRTRTEVSTKTTGTDMVTDADRASESLIAARLAERRPGDGLVAEEGAARTTSTGVVWIADPLDGTTNFLYGLPVFGVSIAAEVDGVVVAGAVRDPIHRETFTAAAGAGASMNGRPLLIQGPSGPLSGREGPSGLSGALVGTGFSYDSARRAEQAAVLTRVLPAVRDIRRAGAAAVDLCWVALGRLDAFYERGLATWDWAAGSLIASEAGARTATLGNGVQVAAAPQLFDALVELVGLVGQVGEVGQP
jgi:myo-inositol-1(or 4)-monophosphatase